MTDYDIPNGHAARPRNLQFQNKTTLIITSPHMSLVTVFNPEIAIRILRITNSILA